MGTMTRIKRHSHRPKPVGASKTPLSPSNVYPFGDPTMYDPDDYTHEYVEGQPWRVGYWHVWDDLFDAYGATLDEAIDELRRNMGDKS